MAKIIVDDRTHKVVYLFGASVTHKQTLTTQIIVEQLSYIVTTYLVQNRQASKPKKMNSRAFEVIPFALFNGTNKKNTSSENCIKNKRHFKAFYCS